MRSLNTLLMMLGSLSVLMLGAVPASAMTGEGDAMPPCHEMAATSHDAPDDAPAPSGAAGKAMAPMACCVSCVVAPALQPPERGLVAHPPQAADPVPGRLPTGLSPAPEPGPPKA